MRPPSGPRQQLAAARVLACLCLGPEDLSRCWPHFLPPVRRQVSRLLDGLTGASTEALLVKAVGAASPIHPMSSLDWFAACSRVLLVSDWFRSPGCVACSSRSSRQRISRTLAASLATIVTLANASLTAPSPPRHGSLRAIVSVLEPMCTLLFSGMETGWWDSLRAVSDALLRGDTAPVITLPVLEPLVTTETSLLPSPACTARPSAIPLAKLLTRAAEEASSKPFADGDPSQVSAQAVFASNEDDGLLWKGAQSSPSDWVDLSRSRESAPQSKGRGPTIEESLANIRDSLVQECVQEAGLAPAALDVAASVPADLLRGLTSDLFQRLPPGHQGREMIVRVLEKAVDGDGHRAELERCVTSLLCVEH
jgi:hypothetical protein